VTPMLQDLRRQHWNKLGVVGEEGNVHGVAQCGLISVNQ
jgi:hypothetical protein